MIVWQSHWRREGGISFIFGSQSIERGCHGFRVRTTRQASSYPTQRKAGHHTWEVLKLKERTGHSTMAVTDDGTANGKLLGIVTSRDYQRFPHGSQR